MLNKYFISPASNSINQNNETGSIGQISFQFLDALSKQDRNSITNALVFSAYGVNSFRNVRIISQNKSFNQDGMTSLKFYLWSFSKYYQRPEYRQANIVHHLLPFAPGNTFNPFFLFKQPGKKYVIGPLLGTHVNTQLFKTDDHKSSYSPANIISRLSPFVFGPLNRLTIRQADIVLFSDNFAKHCFQTYLRPSQETHILPIGINQNIFHPASKKPHSGLKILFVGRLTERKGCQYLLQALSQLQVPYHCDIFGSGPQEPELKSIASDLKISSHIRFHGRFKSDSDIVPFYQQADVVVCPALSDTWVTAKQALSCGTPVIITNIASHPEIVQDNINGFLVPLQDTDAIAEKLTLLAKNKSLLKKLSLQAGKLAKLKYNWDNIIKEYLKIIHA